MSASKSAQVVESAAKPDEEQALSPSTVTIIHKTEAGDESSGTGFMGIGKQGTYMSFLMFGSLVFAKFFDILWVPKIVVLICVVIGFYFARSEVFGLGGYGWFARISGFLYLILQQIILLDLAYSWNEQWVEYSTTDGEKGKRWLVGILAFSAMFYIGSFVFIGLMYWQFDGCTDNAVIISITLALPILATLLQTFFTDEGSILTSAIMTAYATYV
eukprot:gene22624-25630_t